MAEQKIAQIDLPMEAIRELCRRWNITEFALFGSVLRENFNDTSDIDVLVQFREGVRHFGDLDLIDFHNELETIFYGRRVESYQREVIEVSNNHDRRESILGSALVIYSI